MGHYCEKPDHVVLDLYYIEGKWNLFDIWAGKVIECCKQSLIDHFDGTLKAALIEPSKSNPETLGQ